MSLQDEKKLVLEMVSNKKITVDEAEELLDALESSTYENEFSADQDIDLIGHYHTNGCICDCGDEIELAVEGIGEWVGELEIDDVFNDLNIEMDDLDIEIDDLDNALEDLEDELEI